MLGLATADPRQLDGMQAYVFAVMGALSSVTLHACYFGCQGTLGPWQQTIAPMFFGDLLGTALVLGLLVWVRSWKLPAFKRLNAIG